MKHLIDVFTGYVSDKYDKVLAKLVLSRGYYLLAEEDRTFCCPCCEAPLILDEDIDVLCNRDSGCWCDNG